MTFPLRLRTPKGLVFDGPVSSVVAEDLDGWFGISPGRADFVAALPPGLLVLRDEEGEAFVAMAGGLLSLRSGECRVMARNVVMSRKLETIADEVEKLLEERRQRRGDRVAAIHDLVREALKRLLREKSW